MRLSYGNLSRVSPHKSVTYTVPQKKSSISLRNRIIEYTYKISTIACCLLENIIPSRPVLPPHFLKLLSTSILKEKITFKNDGLCES
jgi:hypothetical protein